MARKVFFCIFGGDNSQKRNFMLGYCYNTKEIRLILPILKKCFAFNYAEISCELANIVNKHVKEKRLNKELLARYSNNAALYGLYSDDIIKIPVSKNFETKLENLKSLCATFYEDKGVADTDPYKVLGFISAIFDRERSKSGKEAFPDYEEESTEAKIKEKIKSDLYLLYIALHRKGKRNSPIKICLKGDSPHEIRNFDGWMFRLLDEHITKEVGNITLEEAKRELAQVKEQKGRKSKDPYLNYIINGIYNFISSLIPNEEKLVTVRQCEFICKYLFIMGLISDHDRLYDINHLQSTIRSLITSQCTPVQRHGQLVQIPHL